jgi:hypothetical protein
MAGAGAPRPAPKFVWQVVASGKDGPGPRSRHGLVHDERTGTTVLFGGIAWRSGGIMLGDTWELRNGRWSNLDVRPAPPARHRGALVYDPVRQVSVLFGGQNRRDGLLSDTWTYQNGSWAEWGTWFGRCPDPRCGHAMAFSEALGETVLFGGLDAADEPLGDTWLFDGGRWRPVRGPSPPPRRYAAFAYHPGLRGCVLHGGAHDDHGRKQYGDAWLFRDGGWSQFKSEFTTGVRDDHALAFHRAAGAFLMLGGLGPHPGLLAMSNAGWTPADVAALPATRQCAPVAYDPTLNGLVLHGGETHHGGPQFDHTLVLRLEGSATG